MTSFLALDQYGQGHILELLTAVAAEFRRSAVLVLEDGRRILLVHGEPDGTVVGFDDGEVQQTIANLRIDAVLCCHSAQVAQRHNVPVLVKHDAPIKVEALPTKSTGLAELVISLRGKE